MIFHSFKVQAAIAACTFLVFTPILCHGQPDTLWTSAIETGDMYLQVIRTSDGGYAIGSDGGNRRGDGHVDSDYTIVKTDSLGNLVWQRLYSGMPHGRHVEDQGYTIAQTPDGGYVLGGGGAGVAVIIRTDAEGDTLWMRYYEREELPRPLNAMEAQIAPDGNIYIVSYNKAAKIDIDDGGIIWGIEFDARFTGCRLSDDGGFLGGGHADYNIFAVKIDDEGNVDWQQVYEADDAEVCGGITPVSGGGWFLVGTSRFGNEPREVYPFLARIADDGELIWKRVIDEFDEGDWLRDVIETPDGGFAACGFGHYYYYLLRVDNEGDVLWRTYYGDYGRITITGKAYSILLMEDGGYLLGGFSELGCWLVRTEPDPINAVWEFNPAFPSLFSLYSPYPNPFNSTVNISFTLLTQQHVSLTIRDLLGREVTRLVNERLEAGNHHVFWNGLNIPSGVYICRMEAGSFTKSVKLALVR